MNGRKKKDRVTDEQAERIRSIRDAKKARRRRKKVARRVINQAASLKPLSVNLDVPEAAEVIVEEVSSKVEALSGGRPRRSILNMFRGRPTRTH